MIDKTILENLVEALGNTKSAQNSLHLCRWLLRIKELEKGISLSVLHLVNVLEDIPKSSYSSFADALISALKITEYEEEVVDLIIRRNGKIRKFCKILKNGGHLEDAALVTIALDEALKKWSEFHKNFLKERKRALDELEEKTA